MSIHVRSAEAPARAGEILTPEALEFVRRNAFDPPEAAFDAAFSSR